jgi:hypothetical protein
MTFEEQCRLGEQADALVGKGELEAGEKVFTELLGRVLEDKKLDSFIMAKLVLGLLLCLLRQARVQDAFEIWKSSLDDGTPIGIGVYALEQGQTSVHDLMVYFFLSGFLHSMSTDAEAAVPAVNDLMARICNYGFEEDEKVLPVALNNWRLHLLELGDGKELASPERRDMLERYGREVEEGPLMFPGPSRWVIDWAAADAEATVFTPDGEVQQMPANQVDDLGSDE